MDYEISTKDVEPTDVVGLTLTTNASSIGRDATAAYKRLYDTMRDHAIEPTGPPRLVYVEMGTSWEIECCVPVAAETRDVTGLERRAFPGQRVAYTLHTGPYDGLSEAYRALEKWLGERDLHPAGPPWDVYLNDPEEVTPSQLQTEIDWPIVA